MDQNGYYRGSAFGIRSATLGANIYNSAGEFIAKNAIYNTAGTFLATEPAVGDDVNYGNTGGAFEASNGIYDYGVRSYAYATDPTEYNYGVAGYGYGWDERTIFNVGVYGYSNGTNIPDDTTAGIGTWAVYADGDLGYTGNLIALSDSTFKTNVRSLDVNSILSGVKGYSFYFDTLKIGKSATVSHVLQFGVMAQQLERVAPNLVINTILPPVLDSNGTVVTEAKPVKMVNYIGLIPLLVEGYNKQQAQLDSLMQVVAQLSTTGQRSTGSNGNQSTQQLTTELTDGNAIILEQNSPNPFAEQTKITWFIPEDNAAIGSLNAQLYFYNRAGTILKTVPIEQTGYGELTVYANNLSDGTYTYTLVVNGKVIDAKNMVKTK